MRALAVLLFAIALTIPLAAAVRVRVGETILDMPLEQYTAAVVAGESGVLQSPEALKAMAVAIRTYAIRMRGRHAKQGFDFCNTTHCQHLDLKAVTPRIETLVNQTAGELLWYRGKLAFTPYAADCGGRTADIAAVWPGVAAPYLASHADPYCDRSPWHWTGAPEQIAAALRRAGLRSPPLVEGISIVERTPSGRASVLALGGAGESVRIAAGAFRFALGRQLGWNTVRSEFYNVEGLTFQGIGAGHGIGLCQRGAERMGMTGHSYREILAFYYPGTVPGVTASGLAWQRIAGDRIALLSTHPEQDRQVLAAAERLAGAVAQRTNWPLPRDVELRVYPDLDAFRDATGEPGWVAARTEGLSIQMQPVTVLRGKGVLDETLRHELLHVLVESQAAPNLPVWFREGLVEFLAHGGAATSFDGRIPVDADLRQKSNPATARRAYAEAQGAVAAMVRRYGETAVLGWVKGGLPPELTNARSKPAAINSK
jgi:stage II sporulation protein D